MKLTLRDLFWLVLVVGLGLGWWIHQRRLSGSLEKAHTDLMWWPSAPGERLEVYVDDKGVEVLSFDGAGDGAEGTYRAGYRDYDSLRPLKSRRLAPR